MKKLIWILSGLLVICGLPVLFIVDTLALGAPGNTDTTRNAAMVTLYLIPIVWVASAILYRIECKRRNRPKVLRFYRLLPFAVWVLNPLAIMVAAAVSSYFGR